MTDTPTPARDAGPREPGFYWVRLPSKRWAVARMAIGAHTKAELFFLDDSDHTFIASDLREIGPRIPSPDESRPSPDPALVGDALNEAVEAAIRVVGERTKWGQVQCGSEALIVDLSALKRPAAAAAQMSADEAEAQRRSFAYGNAALANPGVTREMVDEQAEKMAARVDVGAVNLADALAEAKSLADLLSLCEFKDANGRAWSLGPEGAQRSRPMNAPTLAEVIRESGERYDAMVIVGDPEVRGVRRHDHIAAAVATHLESDAAVERAARVITVQQGHQEQYWPANQYEARAAIRAAVGPRADGGCDG